MTVPPNPIFTPPVFTYQFSPTTNPLDTPVWVDISPYVLDFHCKYGRQFELNRMEAGTASFTLDNTDRRFDPTNTSSPYYPNLLPIKPIQVIANNVIPAWSGSTLSISGQASGSGSKGYVVTANPGVYSNGLFTALRVQAPTTFITAAQGWAAFRITQ